MPQKRLIDRTEYEIDRSFHDGGSPAEFGVGVGGTRVLLSQAVPSKPEIVQRGHSYFYADCVTPVTKKADVEWLPEPFRTQALAFVKAQAKGQAPEDDPRVLREVAPAGSIRTVGMDDVLAQAGATG